MNHGISGSSAEITWNEYLKVPVFVGRMVVQLLGLIV